MKLSKELIMILRSILKRKYKTLDFIDDETLKIEDILEKIKKETTRKR